MAKKMCDLKKNFVEKNYCWMQFLQRNEPATLVLDGQTASLGFGLGELTTSLALFQRRYTLLNEQGSFKYLSEGELIESCWGWMRDNLKAISRGESKELIKVGKFGRYDASALLERIGSGISHINPDGEIIRDMNRSEDTYTYRLGWYLSVFVEYIHELIHGHHRTTNSGIYKVGFCEYHRRNEPECGRLFVGSHYKTEACDEHNELWQAVKGSRKYRRRASREN